MKRSEIRKAVLTFLDQSPLDDLNIKPLIENLSEGMDIDQQARLRLDLLSVLNELKKYDDIWFTDNGLNLMGRSGDVWFNSDGIIRSTAKYEKEKVTKIKAVPSSGQASASIDEIELLQNLYESSEKISYTNKDDFDLLKKRTELLTRKFFGDDSHYLQDFKSIRYNPIIVTSGGRNDYKTPFEDGLKKFRNLIMVMIEDKKISTNYNDDETNKFIEEVKLVKPIAKSVKEIRVLIASPGDVVIERELLIDKLETKFRREHYEQRCSARIVIDGWETVASQTGYPQDIINSDLVSKANIILAVFRHKLGSPTIDLTTGKDRAASGTAEELLYAIRNKILPNPPVGMAYFYGNAPVLSLDSIDFDKTKTEWDRLKTFKNEIKNEILYKSYNLEEEILDIVAKDLCDNIIKYFTSASD